MELSYYPGCSLHGTAKEYDASTRAVCAALDIQLVELENWSCCGATSGHAIGGELGQALPARNLAIAAESGRDVVVPCSACFSRLRTAAVAHQEGKLPEGLDPIARPVEVMSLLSLFAAPELRARLAERVQRRLTGLSAVTYYGCLLVRPAEVTGEENIEDPQGLDQLLDTLGVTVQRWNYKTLCCGGSLTLSRSDVVKRLVTKLLTAARRSKADCIVTACPMCFANIESVQFENKDIMGAEGPLPIFYFTELLGLALGLEKARKWIRKHLLDARPLEERRGL